jgi:hypothetical protein
MSEKSADQREADHLSELLLTRERTATERERTATALKNGARRIAELESELLLEREKIATANTRAQTLKNDVIFVSRLQQELAGENEELRQAIQTVRRKLDEQKSQNKETQKKNAKLLTEKAEISKHLENLQTWIKKVYRKCPEVSRKLLKMR